MQIQLPERSKECTDKFSGSLKANFGHLEASSGLAGVVKAMLILEKGLIPPNALFEEMNPEIDAEFYHTTVPTRSIPWPCDVSSSPLSPCFISSFCPRKQLIPSRAYAECQLTRSGSEGPIHMSSLMMLYTTCKPMDWMEIIAQCLTHRSLLMVRWSLRMGTLQMVISSTA